MTALIPTKISALPPATTPLTGTELVPIDQGGNTKRAGASSFLPRNYVYMSLFATGGSGTQADPWTGWDSITWSSNTQYNFCDGYFAYSSSIVWPLGLKHFGISTSTGTVIQYNGTGIAIQAGGNQGYPYYSDNWVINISNLSGNSSATGSCTFYQITRSSVNIAFTNFPLTAINVIEGSCVLVKFTLRSTYSSLNLLKSVCALVSPTSPGGFIPTHGYIITDLGTTTQSQWNTIAGTVAQPYAVNTPFIAAVSGAGLGTGVAAIPSNSSANDYHLIAEGCGNYGIVLNGVVNSAFHMYTSEANVQGGLLIQPANWGAVNNNDFYCYDFEANGAYDINLVNGVYNNFFGGDVSDAPGCVIGGAFNNFYGTKFGAVTDTGSNNSYYSVAYSSFTEGTQTNRVNCYNWSTSSFPFTKFNHGLDVVGDKRQGFTHFGGVSSSGYINAVDLTTIFTGTSTACRLRVYGSENVTTNVSYGEYYILKSGTSTFTLSAAVGARLTAGNTNGAMTVQIIGNYIQVKNDANSNLGTWYMAFDTAYI